MGGVGSGRPRRIPTGLAPPVERLTDDTPPAWLAERAHGYYRDTFARLAPAGLLCVTDVDLLAGYADAMADYVDAQNSIARDGIEFDGEPNRMLIAKDRAWLRMQRAGTRLGISPKDRGRVWAHPQASETDSLEELRRGLRIGPRGPGCN